MQLREGRARQVVEARARGHTWKCIEAQLAIANARDYFGRARRLLGVDTLGDAAAAIGLSTALNWAPCCLQSPRSRNIDRGGDRDDHAGVSILSREVARRAGVELPSALRALRRLRGLSAERVAREMRPPISTARLTEIERAARVREDTRARVYDAIERADRAQRDERQARASALLLARARS